MVKIKIGEKNIFDKTSPTIIKQYQEKSLIDKCFDFLNGKHLSQSEQQFILTNQLKIKQQPNIDKSLIYSIHSQYIATIPKNIEQKIKYDLYQLSEDLETIVNFMDPTDNEKLEALDPKLYGEQQKKLQDYFKEHTGLEPWCLKALYMLKSIQAKDLEVIIVEERRNYFREAIKNKGKLLTLEEFVDTAYDIIIGGLRKDQRDIDKILMTLQGIKEKYLEENEEYMV